MSEPHSGPVRNQLCANPNHNPNFSPNPNPRARGIRSARACEPCRLRKIKCTGGIPCAACANLGQERRCEVRQRARPNRALSSKFGPGSQASSRPDPLDGAQLHGAGPSRLSAARRGRALDEAHSQSTLSDGPGPGKRRTGSGRADGSSSRERERVVYGWTLPLPLSEVEGSEADSTEREQEQEQEQEEIGATNGPIRKMEDRVREWAITNGIDPSFIRFADGDHPRLTAGPPDPSSSLLHLPLPPTHPAHSAPASPPTPTHTRETLLMSLFLQSPPQHMDVSPRPAIRALYARYLAVPGSLREDETALVFACLCRAVDMRCGGGRGGADMDPGAGGKGLGEGAEYFRKTKEVLREWGRPSVLAVSALLYLISFAANHGSMCETREVIEQLARQIEQLGIHKRATAELYGEDDQVGKMLNSFMYIDHMTSTLMDLPPTLDFFQIDWDPTPLSLSASTSLEVMRLETEFLVTLHRGSLPPSSPPLQLLLSLEAHHADLIRAVQRVPPRDHRTLLPFPAWALCRASWLGLLLRSQYWAHPLLALSSRAVVARSAGLVLRTYADLAGSNDLFPNWMQLRRIHTSALAIVAAYEEGGVHYSEAEELLGLGAGLVRLHKDSWAAAEGMARGLERCREVIARRGGQVDGTVARGAPVAGTTGQEDLTPRAVNPMSTSGPQGLHPSHPPTAEQARLHPIPTQDEGHPAPMPVDEGMFALPGLDAPFGQDGELEFVWPELDWGWPHEFWIGAPGVEGTGEGGDLGRVLGWAKE